MGITQLLESFKTTEKDVYLTEFPDGTEVHFVLPSWKDANRYSNLIKIVQEDESLQNIICEHIFKKYVQDQFLINESKSIPAGIVFSIVKLMLHLSGALEPTIEDINSLLSNYRASAKNYISSMKRTICTAFAGYTFDKLDSLNYCELLEVYVNAERVLIERGIIEKELMLITPQEEAQQSIESIIKEDTKAYQKFQRG